MARTMHDVALECAAAAMAEAEENGLDHETVMQIADSAYEWACEDPLRAERELAAHLMTQR
jgi:hypothetical protein